MKTKIEEGVQEAIEETFPVGTESVIEVKKGDIIYKAYLRKSDAKVVSTAMTQMRLQGENFDMLSIGEMILRQLFVGGDQEILMDQDVLISASIQAFSLVQILESKIKKI